MLIPETKQNVEVQKTIQAPVILPELKDDPGQLDLEADPVELHEKH
jgi:hypothetical protein